MKSVLCGVVQDGSHESGMRWVISIVNYKDKTQDKASTAWKKNAISGHFEVQKSGGKCMKD